MSSTDGEARRDELAAEFVRLPGLFRRWEIADVVEAGTDFHLEEAGHAADGTPLFAVYQGEQTDGDKEE